MTATVHPICPNCRLEALKLVDDGTACPWCSVSNKALGRPYRPLPRLDRELARLARIAGKKTAA